MVVLSSERDVLQPQGSDAIETPQTAQVSGDITLSTEALVITAIFKLPGISGTALARDA
ncbi:hypothetical protein [Vineibacter terrae]|uniref:hypothetical protein n=1 Tax=Vineibacter terrae TaxID=2586908 RepID=UPI002E321927|nr:hypothetical protein [Vineibacter terrae]HEX2887841.1 hypothetical protein [Vineibacter terrae]